MGVACLGRSCLVRHLDPDGAHGSCHACQHVVAIVFFYHHSGGIFVRRAAGCVVNHTLPKCRHALAVEGGQDGTRGRVDLPVGTGNGGILGIVC